MHIRLLHLNKTKPNSRVEGDFPFISRFANDLAVHLAGSWHIDHQIAGDRALTRQPPPVWQAAFFCIARFSRRGRADMIGAGGYSMLGKLAIGNIHLTAPAQGAPATD